MTQLTVATYNIHKGFSHFNRRVVVHELRERLRELNADIVFLQEVQGAHASHAERFANYPDGAQHDFLAEKLWPHAAYGKNCVYEAGHHGNAILSRHPIVQMLNTDISAHRFESRGLLHCELEIAGLRVHSLCAHFGLFARGRREQTRALIEYVQNEIPPDAPVIIAGDFNDWRNQMGAVIVRELNMHDAFHLHGGKVARSFPARMPLFRLDRIYVRGFAVLQAEVHVGADWQRLSDHAALSASLKLNV
jgi:endonuclease/exonuclease/phosphatase family metal-dependent hydrolase